MIYGCVTVLLVSACGITCDNVTDDSHPVTDVLEGIDEAPITVTAVDAVTDDTAAAAAPTTAPKRFTRAPRRRARRLRGYYNDFRYRNPLNNPNNPNSPYAFRGRPAQPAGSTYDQRYPAGYSAGSQYYDPYGQYYGYPGYAAPQTGYYPYQPYPQPQPQPQPQPPPPTPPPTEKIPDLYYVQKADSQDGPYEYRKASVAPDTSYGRGRRRPFPPHAYGPSQGYYSYPYDPYNRRSPPSPQQPYYQPYQQPYQSESYQSQPYQSQPYQSQPYPNPPYYYPRGAYQPRPRPRPGLPGRPTIYPIAWRLTTAPVSTYDSLTTVESDVHKPVDFTTEASGD